MIDPAAAGISPTLRARVTKDVSLPDGSIIPRGSEVYLPVDERAAPGLKSGEGRLMVSEGRRGGRGDGGFLRVGEQEYQIEGTVYGADRMAGLPGRRVKVSESESFFSRMKRPLARIGSQAIGRASPIPVYGIENELLRGQMRSRAGHTEYVVEVKEGTRFEFVAGL